MNNNIHEGNFVAIDIEATGPVAAKSRIIDIGAIRYVNWKETDRFSSYVNPNRPIPKPIIELTGITNEDVIDAPKIDEIMEKLVGFIGDDVIAGHNINSDYAYLCNEARRIKTRSGISQRVENFVAGVQSIDTFLSAKMICKDMESYSLEALCSHYGIINEHAHRALPDARACGKLLCKMYADIPDACENGLKIRLIHCKVKNDRPIRDSQKKYLIDLLKYHKMDINVRVETLTYNEAASLIDRLKGDSINKHV